ncbi:PrpF31 U4/U6*U5 snRNP-associated pre-mRNA processing factor 31 [Thecamonas trahens ATCC 50062]|uniref:PrpF31 U4/U6*U5 snRNP-associated pre-mRNA processing factor 31 n=1 Tax=Thecamonas trahens ATCC 50062 TaxID=461836 RepID=A0A0L0DVY6_THETB|nr:PrpF31 U4/U6*U5 snRNP-associated pre-mRNA processing factor 31 [Thecamonas trahens ATCC 50062]KNC55678.1 PrpF31 U4/U6*U5 snRNP-associated pre-mRNA processing factor 31 [Thecamonas trahens ATCC 50062]|eukprot:XP_013761446.1 PrpF31 U4/U6*U5 snRNP-associated pre-mRNA processing factor 31 [Thecamonas trahens ATCC 50062]
MDDTFDLLADLEALDDLAPPAAAAAAAAVAGEVGGGGGGDVQEMVVEDKDDGSGRYSSTVAGSGLSQPPPGPSSLLAAVRATVMEVVKGGEEMRPGRGPGLDGFLAKSYGFLSEASARIAALAGYLRRGFGKRFPEMDALVADDLAYVRCAAALVARDEGRVVALVETKDIANPEQLSPEEAMRARLREVLPPSVAMVVAVSLATSSGSQLAASEAAHVCAAASDVEALVADTSRVEGYIAELMDAFAPNLAALVSSHIAARLLALAGGLPQLANITADCIQVLGKDVSKAVQGLARTAALHEGVIFEAPVVQSAPDAHRTKVGRAAAAKAALAARTDASGGYPDGSYGKQLLGKVEAKLAKLLEPKKARLVKALPIPGKKKGSRRGGRRARKAKARWGESELAKATSRVKFGADEDDGSLAAAALRNTLAKAAASAPKQPKFSKAMRKRLAADARHGESPVSRSGSR